MFNKRLKELRLSLKLSQRELAEQIFVSQQALAKWENGSATPNPDTIKKLAEILNVSTDYLLGNSEQKKPATENGDEQLEECVVLHRDGKTQTYKFSQKQFDLIAAMLDQLGGEKIDL